MNETNEPRSSSFQAGDPLPTAAPVGAGDQGSDATEPSQLDRVLSALKSQERWGLVAGVIVQVLVLFSMILMGGWKALTGGF